MSCELYDDVLDEYVDGARAADHVDAPDSRLAAFESHLTGCTRCQALVTDFATKYGRTVVKSDRDAFKKVFAPFLVSKDVPWDKALYDRVQAIK